MNVLLMNLPVQEGKSFHWDDEERQVNHLGIGYIAAIAEQNGHNVSLIDCPLLGYSYSELASILDKIDRFDIVGIHIFHLNVHMLPRLVAKIKKKANDAVIILGGHYASMKMQKILQSYSNVDAVIYGEGENACQALFECKDKSNIDFQNIRGVAWRFKSEVIINPKSDLVDELDTIPFPKRNFFPGQKKSCMVATRGCYGNCSFCDIKSFYKLSNGRYLRARSPQNVFDEIHLLVEKGIDYISFYDDNFLGVIRMYPEWGREFYELMKNLQSPVKFDIRCRVNDCIDNPDLEYLRDVGLSKVYLGIESGIQRSLDFYNKNIKVHQIVEAVNKLRSIGVHIDCGLIFLEPYTTCEEVVDHIEFLRHIQYSKFYEISPISLRKPLLLVPGTTLYNKFQKAGKLVNNFKGYNFENEGMQKLYSNLEIWSAELIKVCSSGNKWQEAVINLDLDCIYDMASCVINGEDVEKVRVVFIERLKTYAFL